VDSRCFFPKILTRFIQIVAFLATFVYKSDVFEVTLHARYYAIAGAHFLIPFDPVLRQKETRQDAIISESGRR